MNGYMSKFITRVISAVQRVGPGKRMFTGIFTIPDPHRISFVGAQGYAYYVYSVPAGDRSQTCLPGFLPTPQTNIPWINFPFITLHPMLP